jgi:uncharacterized protein YlxW (UPF0749 family)
MNLLARARGTLDGGPPLVLVALFGVLGFLVVTAASSVTAAKRTEQPRRAQLAALIQQRRSQVDELDKAVTELRDRVGREEKAAASRNAGDRALSDRLDALGRQAGTVPMRGPGVEVRLSDSSRTPPEGEDASAYRIHDRDVQLVVNALSAAGAEAMSINDVRLVATSPIRAAGATIVVSFRPLSPPYVIKAIGADSGRFAVSDVVKLYGRWRDVFGLGFRVRDADDLQVPAYTGRVAVGTATPTETP